MARATDVAVRVVTTPAEKEDAIRVRWTVFVDEQKVPADEEVDAHDADPAVVHFVGYDAGGRAVAAARLRVPEPDLGKIERVAVLRDQRGRDVGRRLMDAVEEEAARRGLARVKLDAQLQAEGFYARLGYRRLSDRVFLDAGIEHVAMAKAL